MNRWQSKIDALIRLSRDKGATPAERETAARKLRQITHDHPQAMDYKPLAEFTMRDLREMRMRGVSTDGSWTGRNLEEAVALMITDYHGRLLRGRQPRRMIPGIAPNWRENEKRTPMWARRG